jgi:hypothetical protein
VPQNQARSFALYFALACAIAAAFPSLYALSVSPPGGTFTGAPYNADDHMVYAAWMRQAMDGRLLMDNRFTTDAQPGLTIHLYFFALGLIAKVTGIQFAAALGRVVFSGLFVWLLFQLARRLSPDIFTQKLSLTLAVFGAGIGYFVWHTFGVAIVRPVPGFLNSLMLGRLPTDVWQPEGYVFPSMLTTGLFMVSLCLTLVVLMSFLDARESWKPVLPGAAAFFLLMNIHSYDVLLVAFVMVAFLGMAIARRQVTGAWVLRAALIGLAALPPALWFLYVLQNDPVFQARAATPTFSPNFRQVFFGYLFLLGLGFLALFRLGDPEEQGSKRRLLGAGLLVATTLVLFLLAPGHREGFWMGMPAWILLFAVACGSLALLSTDSAARNLVAAWAVVGLVAPYFPALFQRKLSMGLAVPWALLSALGLAWLLGRYFKERGQRNLVMVLAIMLLCPTSVFWLTRQFNFMKENVSNTTMHPVYLTSDVRRALDHLNRQGGRKIVLAMPGVNWQMEDERGEPIVDAFGSPYMPDLNPFISGFTGSYTYAGHWSETPDYGARRSELTRFFLTATSDDQRLAFLKATNATHVLAPVADAFPGIPLADLSAIGEVVAEGPRFRLIEIRQPQ